MCAVNEMERLALVMSSRPEKERVPKKLRWNKTCFSTKTVQRWNQVKSGLVRPSQSNLRQYLKTAPSREWKIRRHRWAQSSNRWKHQNANVQNFLFFSFQSFSLVDDKWKTKNEQRCCLTWPISLTITSLLNRPRLQQSPNWIAGWRNQLKSQAFI